MPDISKSIDPLMGYQASTWREGSTAATPNYPLSGDLIYTSYAKNLDGSYQTDSSGNPVIAKDGNGNPIQVDLTYSQDFWKYMMKEMFPGVTQTEFNQDTTSTIANPLNPNQTISKGAYYVTMFNAACKDFYVSFFQGRDDTTYSGVTDAPHYDVSQWNTLTDDQKQVIINSYLRTRGVGAATDQSAYLGDMSLRYQNSMMWVAELLMNIMSDLQSSTINTGRLSTRLAQTSQSISTEMASSAYNYQAVSDPNDFHTQYVNQQNTQKLENLRAYRNLVQEQTDKASADLTQQNNKVEQQGDAALDFEDKARTVGESIFGNKKN